MDKDTLVLYSCVKDKKLYNEKAMVDDLKSKHYDCTHKFHTKSGVLQFIFDKRCGMKTFHQDYKDGGTIGGVFV